MILLTLLIVTLLILAVIVAGTVCIAGASTIVLFGDVIVCMLVIVWLIKRICRKRKQKKA